MAKTETQDQSEILTVLAKTRRTYQKYEAAMPVLSEMLAALRALDVEIVSLLNHRETLDKLNKDAMVSLAKVEREAQTRLQNLDAGHRAMVDKLTQKEIQAEKAISQARRLEESANKARADYEAIKSVYETKLAALSEIKAKK